MKNILLFSAVLLLCGCSRDIDLKTLENKTADDILKQGDAAMEQKNYSDATLIYSELEKLFPYSKLTADAQINSGTCYYKMKKYDEATSDFEIFIKTKPTHDKVPYALYMLGVINFEQMPVIERDQDVTVKALAYLTELIKRFPTSEYCKDAKTKISKSREQLAGRELHVARYYLAKGNYAAAVGRLNTVIDFFIDTNQAPEALHRLTECYVSLGVLNEAQSVLKVLKNKFPKNEWTAHSEQLLQKYNK